MKIALTRFDKAVAIFPSEGYALRTLGAA